MIKEEFINKINALMDKIEEIAAENKLSFKMGIIPSDVSKEDVKKALKEGRIEPLAYVPQLTE